MECIGKATRLVNANQQKTDLKTYQLGLVSYWEFWKMGSWVWRDGNME